MEAERRAFLLESVTQLSPEIGREIAVSRENLICELNYLDLTYKTEEDPGALRPVG